MSAPSSSTRQEIEYAAPKPLQEFLLEKERYELPPFNDLPRWNNRIVSNLLYFQTNYFITFAVLFAIETLFYSQDILSGLVAIAIAAGSGFFLLNSNDETVNQFRKDHPLASIGIVGLAALLFFKISASVLVAIVAFLFPVLVILIHASLRLRGLANKTANFKEKIGLRTTLMGQILDRLGVSVLV